MDSNPPTIYRFEVGPLNPSDPRSAGYLTDAHALGLARVSQIHCRDLYFVQGHLTDLELERLAIELLSDPVAEEVTWLELKAHPADASGNADRHVIEVALRPGVTDPVAEQIVRAAHEMGISGVQNASTGLHFTITGNGLSADDLDLLAHRLLANPVIQRHAQGQIEPAFPVAAQASGAVEQIPIRSMTPDELLKVSQVHRAALDLTEMTAIQAYFRSENRDCTDVEFEMIAQTWSEHCVHKTLKAQVSVASSKTSYPYPPQIDNILKTYIRSATEKINAPWVISAFSDNAGIIALDDEYEVSFKVETHNHPSAIEPFGGANTGVGGVIRDVMGVSAKPIAATDVLCFGPQDYPLGRLPEGVLHPRRIFSGVVAGVQDYGNKMGIPTVNGAIWYDPGFVSNPLVFCGCVGIAPRGRHPRAQQPGDRVIVLGGGTGRDGLRGATFSSQTMDAQTGEVAGASVQIGAPVTEKGVIEVILKARDSGLYTAITDCGAGGLSSAVGEMASRTGADVDLAQVRLKYPGLAPWEIWLSEAQERMVLAVPPQHLPALQALCDTYEVDLTDIGAFTASNRTVVRYAGKVVLDLDNTFLHDGLPQRHLKAVLPPETNVTEPYEVMDWPAPALVLLRLLGHPNIASKAGVIRIYDHEVQGATSIKPLTGTLNNGPSDACVLKPIPAVAGSDSNCGIVLSNGLNPEYGKLNAYNMAVSAIDEAVRNAVAVGANPDRLAILDNFCWGDPLRPEVMGSLLEAARGCYEAALLQRTPFISGKDSFNNEYIGSDGQRHSIPATLLISAIGVVEDVSKTVTMDLKTPENPVYLVGEHRPCLGGSHYALLFAAPEGAPAWFSCGPTQTPAISTLAPAVYRALHRAIRAGLVAACHDLSEGGLAVAASEMCIAGHLGMQMYLPEGEPFTFLFGETNGCLLVEVPAEKAPDFETSLGNLPFQRIGRVRPEPELRVVSAGEPVIFLPVEDLTDAWGASKAGEA